jgi:hypothetical protein
MPAREGGNIVQRKFCLHAMTELWRLIFRTGGTTKTSSFVRAPEVFPMLIFFSQVLLNGLFRIMGARWVGLLRPARLI